MEYEWNPAKNEANKAKHGVAFEDAGRFDWQSAISIRDDRRDYGETRWITFGMIDNRLHVMVYVLRAATIRLITLRKANARERRDYDTP